MSSTSQIQRKIVIISGTGKQGSAVIAALMSVSQSLSHSFRLLALTRNPQSKKALALKERGIELIQADLNEVSVDELVKIFEGANGLFVAQAISNKEVEQGQKIIKAAEKAGVEQFVYSSTRQAHDAPYVPHFHSKFLIEEHLKKSASIKHYTILRPASFMENLFFGRHESDKIIFWTDPETVVQHIACEDIGKFAAQAFLDPRKYDRQTIELAANTMNGYQLAETFGKVLERPIKYEKMVARDESHRLMVQWIESSKFLVDVGKLKKEFDMDMKSVEQFIRENKTRFE